jgi:hypothetical protein
MQSRSHSIATTLLACAMAACAPANADVPADVITVGLGGSAANCSFPTLREAIEYAAVQPGPNRIWLSRSTQLGYELPGAALEIVDQDLVIVGGFVDCFDETPDELGTDISGNGVPRDPVIRISGEANVQLAYLGITLGDADGGEGGGIDFQGRGSLSLFEVDIHHNHNESTSDDNVGGGIRFRSQGGPASLGLTRTTVFENSARFGAGIAVASENATRVASVEIGELSRIRDNVAVYGGGLWLSDHAELRMRQPGAQIVANRADVAGGGIYALTPIRAVIGAPAAAVEANFAPSGTGSNLRLESVAGSADDGTVLLYRQPGSPLTPNFIGFRLNTDPGENSAAILLASGIELQNPVVTGLGAVLEMNTTAVNDALPDDAERPVACDSNLYRCGHVAGLNVRDQGRAEIARAHVDGSIISAATGGIIDIRDSVVNPQAPIRFTGGAGGRLAIVQSTLTTVSGNVFEIDADGEFVLRDSIVDGPYTALISIVGGSPKLDISRTLVRHLVGVPETAQVLVGQPQFEGGSTFPFRLRFDSPGIDAAPSLMGFPDPSGVERANDQPGLCGAPGPASANARDLGAFETPVRLLNDGFGDAVAPQRDYVLATPLAIPDDAQQSARSPLLVAQRVGYPCPPAEVRVQIDHPRPADLRVNLLAPNQRVYVLYDGTGPIDRSYSVDVGLEPLNGEWALEVTDIVTGVSGTLQSWWLKM